MSAQVSMETLSALIGRIYEAALEPGRWNEVLEAFSTAIGGAGTALYPHDFQVEGAIADESQHVSSFVRIEAGHLSAYGAYYIQRNVWAKNETMLKPGVPVTSEMLYPDRELPRTEFYCDWLRPQGLRYSLGGTLLQEGSVAYKFSCLREERRGPFTESDLALYRLLVPHLQRALAWRANYQRLGRVASASQAAMELMPMGVWLLDADLHVIHANGRARALAQRRDGIRDSGKAMPHATQPDDDGRLQRAARAAVGRNAPIRTSEAMTLRRYDFRPPLQALVTPLPTALGAFGDRPVCALTVTDPEDFDPTSQEVVSRMFGLTPAQSQLAIALASGESLRRYAERRRIAYETARTLLKQVMERTGVRRQTDVVRLILALPSARPPGGDG
jgi:DNA-binding CsgD family transcriptional regulator/PAS domain-containing protein